MSDGPFLRALFGLEGRVALVSGARQGIGEAIAEGLARAGAAVALTSRDRAGLGPLAERLAALGARTLALELELSHTSRIIGLPSGSRHELREALEFAARHGISSEFTPYPLEAANDALADTRDGRVPSRAVLTLP